MRSRILLSIYLSFLLSLSPALVWAGPESALPQRPDRDGLAGFGSFAASPTPMPAATHAPVKVAPAHNRDSRARLSNEDGLQGFGSFERSDASAIASPTASPSPTSSPYPTGAPSSSPTPRPTATQTPNPPKGSGNDLAFLNALLGGAISQALGGAGLGGGLGGLFGGGGGGIFGGGSQGWGGPDAFGGTSSNDKYGQKIDYADKLLEQIQQDKSKQRPGSMDREEEGGVCEIGPGYFSDSPEGKLLGPGDYMGAAHGQGGQFGDGAYKSVAQKTGATYESFAQGPAGSKQMLGVLQKAGRGDDINPLTGKKKNVVIFFNCHGGGDYLEGTGGGIYGRQMANAVIAGGKETGNKDFSHISIVDGGCMPCRGNNMQSQFESAGAEKSINYFSGAAPSKYAWTSGGSGHITQQILRGISEKGGIGPVSLLKSDLIKAVGRVGNGGYFHRKRH